MKERRRARPEQHDPLLLGQEDKQGGAPGDGGSALWQALSDCLSILFLLGYAVCYSVGQMSIYRMRRIHRRLDGGMRHALGSRRADDKVRLRRQADGGRRPGRGIGGQRLEIGRLGKVFRFIGVQNGTRAGARCSLR